MRLSGSAGDFGLWPERCIDLEKSQSRDAAAFDAAAWCAVVRLNEPAKSTNAEYLAPRM